jgi:hypothetical protein
MPHVRIRRRPRSRVSRPSRRGNGPVRRGKGRGAHPTGGRRTAKAGRGVVAAHFAADGPRSRRVIVKARLVRVRGGNSRALAKHLQYLEREGATPEGNPGRAYSASTDAADLRAFDARTHRGRPQKARPDAPAAS